MWERTNYAEGVLKMQQLCFGKEGVQKKSLNEVVYTDLEIRFPGKKNVGDYALTRISTNTELKYAYICEVLNTLIASKQYTYSQLKSLLQEIYQNGTTHVYEDKKIEALQYLIYWTTLQEEINYPRSSGYASINLGFCRLFEAIYCAENPQFCTIEDVKARCSGKPELFMIQGAPEFYTY